MSKYVPPAKTLHKLKAAQDVLKKLSLSEKQLKLGDIELACCQERVDGLGRSISAHLHSINFGLRASSADFSKSPKMNNLAKAVSLYEALQEKEHAILGVLTTTALLPSEKIVLEESRLSLIQGRIPESLTRQGETLLNHLTTAVKSAHDRISLAQKEVVLEKTRETLNTLGYDVRLKSRQSGLLLRGVKQDLSIAAEISKTGTLSLDLAGFEGGACSGELGMFVQKLEQAGIVMENAQKTHHGKKEGGILAQDAAKEIPFNPLQNNHQKRLFALSRQKLKIRR